MPSTNDPLNHKYFTVIDITNYLKHEYFILLDHDTVCPCPLAYHSRNNEDKRQNDYATSRFYYVNDGTWPQEN